jgi:hypothetical protein
VTVELVLGCEHAFRRRLTVYCWWMVAGCVMLLVPVAVAISFVPPDVSEVVSGQVRCLPWLALCSQLGLWPLRYLFRWRLTHDALQEPPQEPWTIRDLLLAMVIVGAALAAARSSGLTGREMVFDSVLVTIVSAAVLIPSTWYVLRWSDLKHTVAAAFGHFVMLIALTAFFVSYARDGFGEGVRELFHLFLVSEVLPGMVLVGALIGIVAMRLSGYRLIIHRETEWPGEWREYGGYRW